MQSGLSKKELHDLDVKGLEDVVVIQGGLKLHETGSA